MVNNIMIVARTVYAGFRIKSVTKSEAGCPQGLLPPVKHVVYHVRYEISDWCILTQHGGKDWECLKEGTEIRFSKEPFKEKICPGANHLKIIKRGSEEVIASLEREPCWETPPEGTVFCPRHFNTSYGRYIRYVFGSTPYDNRNPFFQFPAILYTVYYGEGLVKVGTSIIIKGFRRLLEQPVFLASVIYVGKDVREVRELEIWLSRKSRMSQAPKTNKRIMNILKSLKSDRKKEVKRYACTLAKYVSASAKGECPNGVNLIKESLASKGIWIVDIDSGKEEDLLQCSIPVTIKELNKSLSEQRCTNIGFEKGFILLECDSGKYAIAYELMRDRKILAELT